VKLGLKLSEIVNNDGDQSSSVSVFVVPLRHQGVMFMSTFSQMIVSFHNWQMLLLNEMLTMLETNLGLDHSDARVEVSWLVIKDSNVDMGFGVESSPFVQP